MHLIPRIKSIVCVYIVILMLITILPISPFDETAVYDVSGESYWIQDDWSFSKYITSEFQVSRLLKPGELELERNVDMYIADAGNHRIVKTGIDGSDWTTFGEYGIGAQEFSYPKDVHYDNDNGWIYVADEQNSRIVKTRIDGTGWASYGSYGTGSGNFDHPRGLYHNGNTNTVYVIDTFNDRMVATKMDGSGWETFGQVGNGSGRFHNPTSIYCEESTGTCYVADYSNDRIVKTKMTGSGWGTYGSQGSGIGEFNGISGIVFDDDTGYIYGTDYGNNRVIRTKISGDGWKDYGTYGSGKGQFRDPAGIDYDAHTGYLYIADRGNSRIVRTSISGSGWETFGSYGSGMNHFRNPSGIHIDGKFYTDGHFISSAKNVGEDSIYKTISWDADILAGTEIKFQIRTATTENGLSSKDFVGPNGDHLDFYVSSDTEICSVHNGDKWVQYKAYLSTTDVRASPVLKQVEIRYNIAPKAPELKSPDDLNWTKDDTPHFSWSFSDTDPGTQEGFQLQIDDDITFDDPFFDSGEIGSTSSSYTPKTPILDGKWQWRVRVKDSDGDWSTYCKYWTLFIDTTPPEPFEPTADPSNWTANTKPEISFETEDVTSNVDRYEVQIDDGEFSEELSPITLPTLSDGIHKITVRATDFIGNYIDSSVNVYIDSTPPNAFTPVIEPSGWSGGAQVSISFKTTDRISGMSHYEIDFNNSLFERRVSPYLVSSLEEGTHKITVRAVDAAGNHQDATTEILIDTTPPVISHSPVIISFERSQITIEATITDEDSGVGEAYLNYRFRGEATYAQIQMVPNGDVFIAIIPAELVRVDIEYYIEASDRSTPANIKFFGADGDTIMTPKTGTDIDITVGVLDSEVIDGGGDKESGGGSIWLWIMIMIVIIAVVVIIAVLVLKRKKAVNPLIGGPEEMIISHSEPFAYGQVPPVQQPLYQSGQSTYYNQPEQQYPAFPPQAAYPNETPDQYSYPGQTQQQQYNYPDQQQPPLQQF